MKLGRLVPTAVAVLVLGAAGSSYALAATDGHHARAGAHHRAAGPAAGLLGGSYAASYGRLSGSTQAITAKARPRVLGAPMVGKTLTATPGAWQPRTVTVRYQWLVDGKAVPGATNPSFLLSPRTVGEKVSVVVVARKSGWTPGTATSPTRSVLPGSLAVRKDPAIEGRPAVGRRLVVAGGTWSPQAARTTYQWFRGRTPIARATQSTYRVVAADRGARLRVVVSATKPGYEDTSAVAGTARVG